MFCSYDWSSLPFDLEIFNVLCLSYGRISSCSLGQQMDFIQKISSCYCKFSSSISLRNLSTTTTTTISKLQHSPRYLSRRRPSRSLFLHHNRVRAYVCSYLQPEKKPVIFREEKYSGFFSSLVWGRVVHVCVFIYIYILGPCLYHNKYFTD